MMVLYVLFNIWMASFSRRAHFHVNYKLTATSSLIIVHKFSLKICSIFKECLQYLKLRSSYWCWHMHRKSNLYSFHVWKKNEVKMGIILGRKNIVISKHWLSLKIYSVRMLYIYVNFLLQMSELHHYYHYSWNMF